MEFRADLQGLRAVAVILVLLAHANLPMLEGGFIGVDVFFVLSGYLITGLLLQQKAILRKDTLTKFYARRLKRLFPALLVVICVTVYAATLLLSPAEVNAQTRSAPYAIGWLSNFFFSFSKIGYFDELSAKDLFLHTWSLGVEEQFYLLWPFVIAAITRPPIGTYSQQRTHSSAVTRLSIAFLAGFAISALLTYEAPDLAFYMMPSRFWQFALGGLIQALFRDNNPSSAAILAWLSRPFHRSLLLFSGVSLILASALEFEPNMCYPGFWALLPSTGAALIIATGHQSGEHEGFTNPLNNKALVWIGDRSYSLYLWHWPVFSIGFSLAPQDSTSLTLSVIALSALAAILSYRFVELPFWKGRLGRHRPQVTLVGSTLAMAAALATLLIMPTQRETSPSTRDLSNQWRLDMPAIYQLPCDSWYKDDRVTPCVFGNKSANKTIVLLGDSIGAQWFSAVADIFRGPEWRVIVLTKSACPMVDEDIFYPRIGKIYQVCTRWRNAVLHELGNIKPDLVIMGSASTYQFDEKSWLEGTARVLERVNTASHHIFIIPGTPSLGFDGPGCIDRNLRDGDSVSAGACIANNRMEKAAQVTRYLTSASSRFPNAHVLNLSDLPCHDGTCRAVSEDGIVIFRDSQHLTDSFVRSVTPAIRERITHFYDIGDNLPRRDILATQESASTATDSDTLSQRSVPIKNR